MYKRTGYLAVLTALLAVCFFIDMNAGFAAVSLRDFTALLNGTASPAIRLTVMEFRLPRVLLSLLVGVGLSASGCVLQGVSRNALADPGILGINAGAGLGVAICITLFSQSLEKSALWIPLAALAGALLTALAVYALSYLPGEGLSSGRLVLTGVALASALHAATIMLLLRMRQDEYGFVAGWLSGNIWGANWQNIRVATPWIALLLVFVLYRATTLNLLSLGSQAAAGLGVQVQRHSLLLLGAAVALSSICAAVGGGIAFVGLACPHLARRLVGNRHQVLLPASALIGGCLMLVSDTLSRALFPSVEIPIGIVATVIGAPYFLYLLAKQREV